MEYRRFANTIVARMDKGEEILEKIREIAAKEHILEMAHFPRVVDDVISRTF